MFNEDIVFVQCACNIVIFQIKQYMQIPVEWKGTEPNQKIA